MGANKYPYIICHMLVSLDGKITSGSGVDIFDDYFQLYTDTEDSYNANSWLCGRVTMEMFASKHQAELPADASNLTDDDHIVEPVSEYYFFGIDTRGVLRWDSNTINMSNITEPVNLVIIVTQSTPKAYLQYLHQKRISYIVAGEKQIDFELLFTKIKTKFKITKLLLEGGGLLNGSVLKDGFIDELSLILTPFVVNNSKAPSLFELRDSKELKLTHFKLIEVKELERSGLWLRYNQLKPKK